jgi:hypothetical protein
MSSTTDQGRRRLAEGTGSIWLVQGNPRLTGIAAVPLAPLPTTWCVRRFVGELRRGDRMVLWLSGAAAGVYALGEICADVRPDADEARRRERRPVRQAPLDLFVDLRARPVRRATLRDDPRFAGESILRQPFAANPHRVSATAFDAILERVAAG